MPQRNVHRVRHARIVDATLIEDFTRRLLDLLEHRPDLGPGARRGQRHDLKFGRRVILADDRTQRNDVRKGDGIDTTNEKAVTVLLEIANISHEVSPYFQGYAPFNNVKPALPDRKSVG